MTKEYVAYYNSPIGLLEIKSTEQGITTIEFVEEKNENSISYPSVLEECINQLDQYFLGQRKKFSVRLQLLGTEFQKKVWKELLKIPYGEMRSYLEIATAIGNKNAARAVGGANKKNKIAIIIPCHRIIGSNGKLTGYNSGLNRKKWLLAHETS